MKYFLIWFKFYEILSSKTVRMYLNRYLIHIMFIAWLLIKRISQRVRSTVHAAFVDLCLSAIIQGIMDLNELTTLRELFILARKAPVSSRCPPCSFWPRENRCFSFPQPKHALCHTLSSWAALTNAWSYSKFTRPPLSTVHSTALCVW